MKDRKKIIDEVVKRVLEIEKREENLTLRANVRSLEDEELKMWYKELD